MLGLEIGLAALDWSEHLASLAFAIGAWWRALVGTKGQLERLVGLRRERRLAIIKTTIHLVNAPVHHGVILHVVDGRARWNRWERQGGAWRFGFNRGFRHPLMRAVHSGRQVQASKPRTVVRLLAVGTINRAVRMA